MSQEEESAGPSVHEPSQDDIITLHPSKENTNGIDGNHTDSNEAEDIYASVDCINNDDDVLEPQVDPKWAKTVNNSWDCTKPYIKMKPTFDKYNCPENCSIIRVPKMNLELWKLFDKYQRKRDLQMSGVQKTLTKVAAATLKLNEFCVSGKCDKKMSLQITADIIAMLGHASHDLSLKRELQCENKLISYKRAFKMLENDMYIAGIGQAVLELLSFKDESGNHQRGISFRNFRTSSVTSGSFH